MYQVLYRAYRPEVFGEVLGQDHVVKILKNQICMGTVNHAYLFCGTRGTGKTTVARLLAKGVNCLAEDDRPCGVCENCRSIKEGSFMDIVEIDAASNNGVDNIRELRDSVKYPPAVGKRRVFIIDEVHMLSTGAFNALLKTLEEPPAHVMFVLATTEPQKLPQTILSRCMRMDFRRVSEDKILAGMKEICAKQKVDAVEGALRLIASHADGSVRDGLTLLDQCISGRTGTITREDVLESLGTVGEDTYVELTDLVALHDIQGALVLLDGLIREGKDARELLKGWMGHYRNLMMVKFIKNPEDMLNMSTENIDRIREQANRLDLPEINLAIMELSGIIAESRFSTQPRILLEMVMIKLAAAEGQASYAAPVKVRQVPQTEHAPAKTPADSAPETEASPGGDPVKLPADVEELWQKIFEDGETQKGSFNIIRKGASLEGLTEKEFVVSAGEGVRTYLEANALILEDLMEKHTGKRRIMRIVPREGGPSGQKKQSSGDLASRAESVLGIPVEIK